jgi:putative ABC transport system permease protein
MNSLSQDLRYAVRMSLKKPGLTLMTVLALALGIGANTAIFSVVNAVLIQPLPFAQPERLCYGTGHIRDVTNQAAVSPLDYQDYREQNKSFAPLAAMIVVPVPFNMTGNGEPERLSSAIVTGDYFEAFGVRPALGRVFTRENERPGEYQVVVLSHGLWQRRFGGDPNIINRTVTFDGKSFTVLGVMPREFRFPQTAELWAPMSFQDFPEMKQRKAHFLRLVGRLKDGVTAAQAQTELDGIARHLAELYPDTNRNWSLALHPLGAYLTGDLRPTLLILLGAVGLVLAVACANVANLLLVRATERQKEIAIRTALGAGRGRIIRQMFVESLLLALTGGGIGVLIAAWGVDLLTSFSAAEIPSTANIRLDATVLGFTFGISVLVGLLFGLAPAFAALRVNLQEALKDSARGATGRRGRLQSLLVVAESALAVMLLIGAGLLIRSLITLQNVSPGFEAANVLTMRLDLARQKYDTSEKIGVFYEELRRRIASLPGVEAVGLVSELPLSGQPNDMPFTIKERPSANPDERLDADHRRTSGDYFRAMRIPLRRGRLFTDQEVRQHAPVVVITEELARRHFPQEDPLGKHLILSFGEEPYEIIGIVGDVRHRALEMAPWSMMYLPSQGLGWSNLVIRTQVEPLNIAAMVRREIAAIDREQPVANIKPMTEWVSESAATPRYRTILLGLFAALALILAAVGLYGVISYTVAQRTHEIGIRMALGASRRDVVGLILAQGMKLSLVGSGIGLLLAAVFSRVIGNLLDGVSARDPLVFLGVAALLTVVALIAAYLPARRATRVDPLVALRCD